MSVFSTKTNENLEKIRTIGVGVVAIVAMLHRAGLIPEELQDGIHKIADEVKDILGLIDETDDKGGSE